MRISRNRIISTVIAVITMIPAITYADAGSLQGEEAIRIAREALENNDFPKAAALLESLENMGFDRDQLIEAHYMSGVAVFMISTGEIRKCRSEGQQEKGKLQAHQKAELLTAMDHFKKVFETDPEHRFAAESMFMAGRILGIGYLQHFDEAMDMYRKCSEMYPDSDVGPIAKKRYEKLESYKTGEKHGDHP